MDSPKEFRISLTVDDFEKAIAFYSEVLGLPIENDWTTPQGRCIVLSVAKATIEIIDHAQANLIDAVEVGQRVAGQVRFAFQFSNVQSAVARARTAGAQVLHDPVVTPWKDINARLVGPDGMQMTLFQSPAETK
jgi:predicted enzyme related to lactoylglutathione lyase